MLVDPVERDLVTVRFRRTYRSDNHLRKGWKQQIEEFQPDVIVSVHAPYHLLDFDGPAEALAKIGELYLHQLGVYRGSLGDFAGLNRQIPVVTLELPSAGIMPPAEQIDLMWKDLVAWLDREGRKGLGRL
jgi:hypothetical protein